MKIFDTLAMLFMLSMTLVVGVTFFTAFFNEGEVLVKIDSFGEKWVEVVLVVLAVTMGIFAVYRWLTRLWS